MKIAIMQPGYMPWLGFFELAANCDIFILLDDVQCGIKSWRNRNRIRSSGGWIWLTVPLLHKGKSGQLINEARINDEGNWRRKHLAAIKINYSRAAFYEKYIGFFEELYGREWEYLAELDTHIVSFLCREFGIVTPLYRSSGLNLRRASGNLKILEICRRFNAGELYDSAGARPFIDSKLFEDDGVKVSFQSYEHPVYRQVYDPFIPCMSAVDLLFNEGGRGGLIITHQGKTLP
jgi:hypothetical protein